MPHASLARGARRWSGCTGHARVLVVIGGLPGSGKTTLLRRLLADGAPGVAGFDSEQVTARLRAAGLRLPYRMLRPWVHAVHRARTLRGIGAASPVVVLTDPWAGAWWRAVVLFAARRAGRRVRLVVVDTTPEEAAAGQLARGRALSARAMRRHVGRAPSQRWAARDPAGGTADGALVVDRPRAAQLSLADILG